jgi:hypothetical protein
MIRFGQVKPMAPQNTKMATRIDHPFLGSHSCQLASVRCILFQIHCKVGVQSVKWRQVLDGMEEICLRAVVQYLSFNAKLMHVQHKYLLYRNLVSQPAIIDCALYKPLEGIEEAKSIYKEAHSLFVERTK